MIDWVIQTGVFDKEEDDKLISSILKSGSNCLYVNKDTYVFSKEFYISGNYIFRGSLEKKKELDNQDFCTNVYENLLQYNWSNYAPQENVLNSDYIIIPAGSVKKSKELICDIFSGEELFIKPNDGCKLFAGTTLKKRWFEKEIDIIFGDARRIIKHNDLIVFSSFKEIKNEVRVVMIEKESITYGSYNTQNDPWIKYIVDSLVINNPPNLIYTVDLCIDSGKIVEINSFACAGLYPGTDYDVLVEKVNKFYEV